MIITSEVKCQDSLLLANGNLCVRFAKSDLDVKPTSRMTTLWLRQLRWADSKFKSHNSGCKTLIHKPLKNHKQRLVQEAMCDDHFLLCSWLTVTGLFLSVTLCHTCYRLLLVFSLWNGFGQSQFTLLSRIGCNSLLVVDSPFVYELNSCTFISGAPPYSVLLQNKENILFKYKHLSVCILLNVSCTVSGHEDTSQH